MPVGWRRRFMNGFGVCVGWCVVEDGESVLGKKGRKKENGRGGGDSLYRVGPYWLVGAALSRSLLDLAFNTPRVATLLGSVVITTSNGCHDAASSTKSYHGPLCSYISILIADLREKRLSGWRCIMLNKRGIDGSQPAMGILRKNEEICLTDCPPECTIHFVAQY